MDRPRELLVEAVEKFVDHSEFEFAATEGGVNNVVKRVTDKASGSQYILRIYNNGGVTVKVRFEHHILDSLKGKKLSFSLPVAIESIEGDTFVSLSDGSDASLFHIIAGALPQLSFAEEIGSACGELTLALAELSNKDTPTPPYFEIYKVHHAVTRELFFSEMSSEAFLHVRESAFFMVEEILKIEELISKLLRLELPQQLIHGDLHYDNVLVQDGKVSGVLDFEFVALDWRAMDLAICLSKYAGTEQPLHYFRQVIRGYVRWVALTPLEVESVADLVVLRILSNVVYFVGRALAGEDSIRTLTERIDNYAKRIVWLRQHRQDIIDCFRDEGVACKL